MDLFLDPTDAQRTSPPAPRPIADVVGASEVEPCRGPALQGYAQFSFTSGDFTHSVYHSGNRADPALLVMPEIAGFSPGVLQFAERLVEARFQVYIPWLFGPFRRRAPARNALKLCISREFAYLRAGVSAPVTDWLRALAAYISDQNSSRAIGAIGMCLTGAFAIPLIIDPKVAAAVAAQPAVPLSPLFAATGWGRGAWMHRLNVSDEDIAAARARLNSGSAHLFALRCRADRLCPHEKLERLQHEFPLGLRTVEYGEAGSRNRLGDRPHATFTKEYRLEPDAPPEHHSRRAMADLLIFFDQHLRPQPAALNPFATT